MERVASIQFQRWNQPKIPVRFEDQHQEHAHTGLNRKRLDWGPRFGAQLNVKLPETVGKWRQLTREGFPTLSSGGQTPRRICIRGSWMKLIHSEKQCDTETHLLPYFLLWFPLNSYYTTSDAHTSFIHHTFLVLKRWKPEVIFIASSHYSVTK